MRRLVGGEFAHDVSTCRQYGCRQAGNLRRRQDDGKGCRSELLAQGISGAAYGRHVSRYKVRGAVRRLVRGDDTNFGGACVQAHLAGAVRGKLNAQSRGSGAMAFGKVHNGAGATKNTMNRGHGARYAVIDGSHRYGIASGI